MNTKTLRLVGILEGISFLFLLGIAMPLKYMYDMPIVVTYAGMAHGFLFLAFLVVLFSVCHQKNWSILWFVVGLISAILPFGTFVFDWKIKKLDQASAESAE